MQIDTVLQVTHKMREGCMDLRSTFTHCGYHSSGGFDPATNWDLFDLAIRGSGPGAINAPEIVAEGGDSSESEDLSFDDVMA